MTGYSIALPFDKAARQLRNQIKNAAGLVQSLHKAADDTTEPAADKAEMHANIELAYRKLEDAAMRLGKAIQAFDGGKSVYDP